MWMGSIGCKSHWFTFTRLDTLNVLLENDITYESAEDTHGNCAWPSPSTFTTTIWVPYNMTHEKNVF